MEKKSIGSFIAALRKANGLTQRELAEKLNVSDKTVSRWERDESSPDLSLIPVIAELFGITSDELLLGHRNPSGETPSNASAGEKQRRRLLASSLSKYQTKSCLAAALAVCGFIAALVGNFAFLRAYLGFYTGTVLFLAAGVVQFAAVNAAFLSIDSEEFSPEQLAPYRRRIILTAERISGLIAVLFGSTVALLLVGDAYMGLSGNSFFQYGILFGIAAFVVWAGIRWGIHHHLVTKGVYPLDAQQTAIYRHNIRYQKLCALSLVILLPFTAMLHGLLTGFGDPMQIAEGTTFQDLEDFKEFMEQDIPYEEDLIDGDAPVADTNAGGQYYDEQGNPITEEEAFTQTVRDPSGNILCKFVQRNMSVDSWKYTFMGDTFQSATAYTYQQVEQAQAKIQITQAVFLVIYCLECTAVLIFYCFSRKKMPV